MSDQFTIGIDFGTLSGRAVVVRVSDGAELGSAVHEYPHAVMDTQLTAGPASGAGDRVPLPPAWALQVPADYVEVLQHAVPAAVRAAGIDPAQVVGLGTDFTACTMLPVLDDGTPLCELPRVRRPPARLRQALEAPRRPAARRPDQRARAPSRRTVDRPVRRPDLQRVGVRQGPAAARGGRRDLPPHGPLGGGRGLDRLAADRPLRPQRLHRRLQGDAPGRPLPGPGLPGRAEPRTSRGS